MILPTIVGFPSDTRFACGAPSIFGGPSRDSWALRLGRPGGRVLLLSLRRDGDRLRVALDVSRWRS